MALFFFVIMETQAKKQINYARLGNERGENGLQNEYRTMNMI